MFVGRMKKEEERSSKRLGKSWRRPRGGGEGEGQRRRGGEKWKKRRGGIF